MPKPATISPKNRTAPEQRLYSAKELLELEYDPKRWIVEKMIPKQGITMVFGESNSFKTTLLFDLCVATASGGSLIKTFPVLQQGPVLIVSTESSIYENKARLMAHFRYHGQNPADLPLYYCQDPFMLDDPADVSALEYYIDRVKPVFVALDPLDSFFSGEENSAKETKQVRFAINRLRKDYGCSFIIIHHAGKGKKSAMRGSSAWDGWADTVIKIKSSLKKIGLPDDTRVLEIEAIKQRNAPKGHLFSAVPHREPVLDHQSFVYYNGQDATGIINHFYKFDAYTKMREVGQPMTRADIAMATGIRPERLDEPLAMLKAEGLARDDVKVYVSCSSDGSRRRSAQAWQAVVRHDIADMAETMVKLESKYLEEDSAHFSIVPRTPEELSVVAADSSTVREPGG